MSKKNKKLNIRNRTIWEAATEKNISRRQLAKEFGISRQRVQQILREYKPEKVDLNK